MSKVNYKNFALVIILIFQGCEKCSECPNDLTARFRFVDSTRQEILNDPSLLTISDFQGLNYTVDRETVNEDIFYTADFRPLNLELESPDTVLFFYNNMFIDSVDVSYTFTSDSRCCTNTLKVNRLNFFQRDEARRIKPEYVIIDVIVD